MLKKMLLASGGKKPIEFVGGYTVGFLGTTSDKVISLTSLTGGLDTHPSEGDIVIVINGMCYNTGTPATLPNGYTQLFANYASSSYSADGNLSYKIMPATPDTSLTIVGGTGHIGIGGGISLLVFRNVDISNPIDVTSQTYINNSSVLVNPPSITPSTNGAIIVAGGVGGHNMGEHTFTSSDLTNFISSGVNDNGDCTTGIGYTAWTSGAFDPAQFGFTGTGSTSFSSIGYSMVIRPQ